MHWHLTTPPESNIYLSVPVPLLQSLYQGQTAKEETAFSFQVQYQGLSPQAAAQAVEAGSISTEDAQLYFTVIERIRQSVTDHFKLRTELFHHFTHIVCRSPNIGESLSLRAAQPLLLWCSLTRYLLLQRPRW